MPLKGVLFDLDGTLIDFQIDYQQCRKQTIEVLVESGYPPNFLNMNSFVLKMVQDASNYFISKLGYSPQRVFEIRKKIDSLVAQEELKAAQKAHLIPGMQTVLEFLNSKEIKIGIITLNTTENAKISLQNAKIIQYFERDSIIVGRDRTDRLKPDPSHASEFLRIFNLKPSEVCIIGDHPSDIETANHLNARSIAVISEKHPKEEFDTPFYIY